MNSYVSYWCLHFILANLITIWFSELFSFTLFKFNRKYITVDKD
ncbi:unnamed protein product [Arabidopsis halleri]